MGNTIMGGRKRAKVMNINGEVLRYKIPVRAGDVVKDYPGHVILDSDAVKHSGISAKPLGFRQELKSKKVYFLMELPKSPPHESIPRRVRSSIHMTAKDRLEFLMLSRRSVSDMSIVRSSSSSFVTGESGPGSRPVRVKIRLPKSQVAKLVEQSRNEVEVAERIMDLYVANGGGVHGDVAAEERMGRLLSRKGQWPSSDGNVVGESFKAREKRVVFAPINREICEEHKLSYHTIQL